MSWHRLRMLRRLNEQVNRIPQTPLGELAKKVLLAELGTLGKAYTAHLVGYGSFGPRKRGPRKRLPVKVTVECYHCEELLNASEFPLCEVRNALLGKAATCSECSRRQSRKAEVEIAITA